MTNTNMQNTNIKTLEAARVRAAGFRNWILQQVKPDGSCYSTSSARQYVAQLRNYAHKLAPHALDGTNVPEDLFELDRLLDFDTAVAIIAELPGYDDFIAGNHGNFTAAATLYHRFMEETPRTASLVTCA